MDGCDLRAWREALLQPTTMVLLESPSNPMLEIVDLRTVCGLAHAAGALVVVDNVFATPLLQQPMQHGADIVVYSCTKHIDGQGRILGGAILGRSSWIEGTLQPFLRNTGPNLASFNAWLLLKSLDTLGLRVEAGCRRAEAVADYLSGKPHVSRVLYPTRQDHPQFELARTQMSGGGTVVTFELAGGRRSAFIFMNALRLIAISNNLGDTKSLITHPATTTHMRIAPEERQRLGITNGVIRLSVGLEDADDLCADLELGFDMLANESRRPKGRRVMDEGFTQTTHHIEVSVKAFFLEDQSDPDENRYVWAYRVRIRNTGQQTVQLLRRKWQITDGRGQIIEVEGAGVVGENPILEPGDGFEFTSGTPLNTPTGFMEGSYQMVAAATGEILDIAIPAFSLDSPHSAGWVH